jgi:hypothetical protein
MQGTNETLAAVAAGAYSDPMKTSRPAVRGEEPPDEAVTSPGETREHLLKLSGRGYTVVRHILRQQPDDVSNRASVLGPIVTDRKRRALQLYLLLLAVWGWLDGKDELMPAGVWARALTTEKGRRWTPTNVSAAWADLEARGLIERRRLQHGLVVKPRREDGKAAYTQPGKVKRDRRETYFVLPAEFWTGEWFEKLTLPGLAMLLIIAGETSDKMEVWLTNEDAGRWYGMSPRSVEAGIKDLEVHGLLKERTEWIKAPLSAVGSTKRHWYSLSAEFSYTARAKLQEDARAEFETRTWRSGRARKATDKKTIVNKGAAGRASRARPGRKAGGTR